MLKRLASKVLDTSIFFSFDASGFERHAKDFDPLPGPGTLRGQNCLITGANSGLGFATARALARMGAHVFMLCRSEDRGRDALRALQDAIPDASFELCIVDMSSGESIRSFVRGWERPVHRLIHNAGILPPTLERNNAGMEMTFATNTLGPFLLTRLLTEQLKSAEASRVISVSSGGMYSASLDLSVLQGEVKSFDGVKAYAQTKRAQVILTQLWAERWGAPNLRFDAMHPGWAATPGVEKSLPGFWDKMENRLRTPAQGADTTVWLASAAHLDEPSGTFWFDRKPAPTHLVPWTRETPEQREALWALCETHAG